MVRRISEVVLALWGLAVIGCGSAGPEVGAVSGLVTLDGKPAAKALVTFAPIAGGMNSTAMTDDSGMYVLQCADRPGALVGKHKVSVMSVPEPNAINPDIRSDDPEYEKQYESQAHGATAKLNQGPQIPDVYGAKSSLEFEVKSGNNTINLELKSS